MERKRLFLAIKPPPEICQTIAATAEGALRPPRHDAGAPGARPALKLIATANLHITLLFLGDTPVERIADIHRAVTPHAERRQPFRLSLAAFGCFPSPRNPRVVWIGLADPAAVLGALQADIRDALGTAGFTLENRPFRAHITAAYVRRDARQAAAAVRAFLQRANNALQLPAPHFTAREIRLYESELRPSGARHHTLWSIDLQRCAAGNAAGTQKKPPPDAAEEAEEAPPEERR
ncbi:MAG: RNA 2',3'-cyclic phosphodiesterase [Spirochaetaceae bacterium]|nr:MAG: RNA 2',3'-cyclic phosphodiesterase [Spirochaetaceae bacterium]